MKALTQDTPKPLLKVAGKTLLAHKFDILPESITEIILIVGYFAEQVRASCGDSHNNIPIRYVVQDTLDGTAGALWKAREFLTDRFVVMMGDDLYEKKDLEACIATEGWSMLVQQTPHIYGGGRIVIESGTITVIEEGDHGGISGALNTGMQVLDTRIFTHPPVPKSEGSSEYGLPQTTLSASLALNIPLMAVPATAWFQVSAPEDLEEATAWISTKHIEGKGEK